MAKFASCVLVLVAAFFVADGINIPAPTLRSSGKLFMNEQIPSNIRPNDPRCKKDGFFVANPKDCTSYFVCLHGTSQERKCPEGMKFDSRTRCTFEKDADCGVTTLTKIEDSLKCPSAYGIYAYQPDCRKYLVCVDSIPSLRTCPTGQWFQERVGCIAAKKCPRSSSEREDRSNQLTDVLVDE